MGFDNGDWKVRRAPWVDLGSSPTPSLEEMRQASGGVDGFFAGFLAAVPDGGSTLYWSGQTVHGDATVSEHGRADIIEFRSNGGNAVLTFGGPSHLPLEAVQTDPVKIADTYEAIINNYRSPHINFFFENETLADPGLLDRHIAAVKELLTRRYAQLSYTLETYSSREPFTGFTSTGIDLLHRLASAGIPPSLVNARLTEFGHNELGDAFTRYASSVLIGMAEQVLRVWPDWPREKVKHRLGVTPAFGRNSTGNVFTLQHMEQLRTLAQDFTLGCLSGWDALRDRNQGHLPQCDDPDKADLTQCTGIQQQPYDFSKIIAKYQPKS